MYLIGQQGLRRSGWSTTLVTRRRAAASFFSLAIGKASRKVLIRILPNQSTSDLDAGGAHHTTTARFRAASGAVAHRR